MGVRSLLQRESGVDARHQLPACGCRKRMLGVIAALGFRLAQDGAERPGQGEAASGDGLDVQRGPAPGRVAVHADAACAIGDRVEGGCDDLAADGIEDQARSSSAGQLAYPVRPVRGGVVDRVVCAEFRDRVGGRLGISAAPPTWLELREPLPMWAEEL
jgi:hypothetical protein